MQMYADYLFLIPLPAHLEHENSRYKQASVGVIGQYDSMASRGQITVCRQHRCKPFLVNPALERMEARINTMPAIDLKICGFNFSSHAQVSYTIYAKVEAGLKVNNWFKLLFNQIQMKCTHFSPHITIARNIPGSSFGKLWPNFEGRKLDFTITADHMLILQRPTYIEQQEWDEYKKIYFLNKIGKVNEAENSYLL